MVKIAPQMYAVSTIISYLKDVKFKIEENIIAGPLSQYEIVQ